MTSKNLSPTMQACRDFMVRHGGKITRHPGGFWSHPGWTHKYSGECYGTTTVEALVRRGVAAYTEWKENRNGRFPIEATLHE